MAKPSMTQELILEAPKRLSDGGGGFSLVWTPVGTIWAEVQGTSARERVSGAREATHITHKITMRSAPVGSPRRPSPECRFRSGDRLFAIRGVVPSDDRNQYLTCWAEEGPFA